MQRGMTLVELVVAVAIAIVAAVALVALNQGGRPYAAQSSVQQFDAALAYAQSLAATSGNGATMVFAPSGDGFVLTLYSGRPTSTTALSEAHLAATHIVGSVVEAKLGGAPFSVFLNGAGHASAASGAVAPGSVIASDPGCPAGESSVTLTFSDPRQSVTRSLPCGSVP
jgi:type II secretory pathway pseudopilin PulG